MGLIHRGGRYHLFYQYVPDHTDWQPFCSWGHSSSADLISWTEHQPALSPGEGDLGCWSGQVIDDVGGPVIYYTSVNEPNIQLGSIRKARPLDHNWENWSKGPVVVRPPDTPDLVAFRDPSVIRDGSVWRMLVGAGYADGHAAVLSYSSPDRQTWTYDGPAIEQSRRAYGDGQQLVWECPHIIQVDGRHVLIVSVLADGHTSQVEAAIGDYCDGRFTAEAWMPLTDGLRHYAASPFTDAGGHPGLMFWIREAGGAEQGWAGAQSIPYRLAVEGGSVRLRPHPTVMAATPDDAGIVGLDWWPVEDAASLDLPTSSGCSAISLEADGDTLLVRFEGSTVTMRRDTGPVSLLADHSLLEVCTGAAVAAFDLPDEARPPPPTTPASTIPWGATTSGAQPDAAALQGITS